MIVPLAGLALQKAVGPFLNQACMDRNEEESAAWILQEVSDDALRVRLQWQPADRPSPSLYLPEAEDALCMVAGSDGCNWNRTLSPSPR
jgi:hypothetical protein